MGVKFRELILLLTACALAFSEPLDKVAKKDINEFDNDLYSDEDVDEEKVLFNENKPCPRDCICTVSQGYSIAKCNRLEVNTQQFSDNITDLVIENADPLFPIQLDDFIFKKLGLQQVATIKIVNSTIGYISPNAFKGLHEVYAINLSNNKIKNLHPQTFANNKKLLILTLANNPLQFSSTNFLNASSLQELDISYCNLRNISNNTFKDVSKLMYVNLAGNNLTELDPDTFKYLLDLEELDLSDNSIKSLPDDIFSENVELITLHIQRNPIDTVYGLQISDLLTLNAGQTNIKFVGPSMFNGMTYIANLNLSGNSIEKIHNQAFHKLVELNYLDLSYNDLDFISSILIKENIELDIFKISNNPKLKHLPADGFNCSAEQFNIYLFDASNCGLEEIYDDSLKTFTALSQINLSKNNIKSINNKVFSNCKKLVEINLSHNMISTLDAKAFQQNKDLVMLNLQENPLHVLSVEIFTYIPALSWLDISQTELTSLYKVEKTQPTTILNNLKYLNISHNRITEIKQSEMDHLNNLLTLDIRNNPLACSREFENLMTWLINRKVSPNANVASIANLVRDKEAKEESTSTYSWEFLEKATCGTQRDNMRFVHSTTPKAHHVEILPEILDEEIWERTDKDAEGNFDLKNTLDDAKMVDDTKVNNEIMDNDDFNNSEDMDDEEADDEEEDDEENDDASEDLDDDDDDEHIDLNVAFPKKKDIITKVNTSPNELSTKIPKDEVKIDINLLENDSLDYSLEQDVYVQASVTDVEHSRYGYLWPILIALLGAMLILLVIGKVVMMTCNRRNKQIRYNSAIIAAMSHQGRTKKDCGLVYQQLSEDLTGPATPKLNRYTPLHGVTVKASNMSYESSPFHHSNIVPEAV